MREQGSAHFGCGSADKKRALNPQTRFVQYILSRLAQDCIHFHGPICTIGASKNHVHLHVEHYIITSIEKMSE